MSTTDQGQVGDLYSEELGRDLIAVARRHADEYQRAEPFPHAVIHDFLPSPLLDAALEEFPVPGGVEWTRFSTPHERKLAFQTVERLPASLRGVLQFLNSAPALQFLETLTGIPGLIPDPYFEGGGLHQIEPGGMLEVHADFNKLKNLRLDRRLNLLLYMNKGWQEGFGGHLELWEPDMSRCVRRVLPTFNTCVVFSTTDQAMHGHPEPLRCPAGMTRKSLATYYYSNGRPEDELSPEHTTVFRRSRGATRRGERAFQLAKDCCPPILLTALRSLKRRRAYRSELARSKRGGGA